MNAEFGPVTDGGNVLVRAVRRAGPASFPVVMATGIVSAALRQAGQPSLSAALLVIAVAVFVILLAASAVRAVAFPASLRADLGRPDRAFTSFAFVAACGVLGYRLAGGGYRLPRRGGRGRAGCLARRDLPGPVRHGGVGADLHRPGHLAAGSQARQQELRRNHVVLRYKET
jgi:hypothetical protein